MAITKYPNKNYSYFLQITLYSFTRMNNHNVGAVSVFMFQYISVICNNSLHTIIGEC